MTDQELLLLFYSKRLICPCLSRITQRKHLPCGLLFVCAMGHHHTSSSLKYIRLPVDSRKAFNVIKGGAS